MSCNCGIVIIDPPPNSCADCLKIYSTRTVCSSGPIPAGDDFVVDLSEINDITNCGEAGAVYTIYSFDAIFWDSVTITSGGVLTAVPSGAFVYHEESEIVYKVTCVDGQLSAYGSVFVCKQDLCFGVECDEDEVCSQATGLCVAIG